MMGRNKKTDNSIMVLIYTGQKEINFEKFCVSLLHSYPNIFASFKIFFKYEKNYALKSEIDKLNSIWF